MNFSKKSLTSNSLSDKLVSNMPKGPNRQVPVVQMLDSTIHRIVIIQRVAASQPRPAWKGKLWCPFGSGDQAVSSSCMIVSLAGQDYSARLFSDRFWFFRTKTIIGSQGISLSFRFLFYLVYYFAFCNFIVKFVFVLFTQCTSS